MVMNNKYKMMIKSIHQLLILNQFMINKNLTNNNYKKKIK